MVFSGVVTQKLLSNPNVSFLHTFGVPYGKILHPQFTPHKHTLTIRNNYAFIDLLVWVSTFRQRQIKTLRDAKRHWVHTQKLLKAMLVLVGVIDVPSRGGCEDSVHQLTLIIDHFSENLKLFFHHSRQRKGLHLGGVKEGGPPGSGVSAYSQPANQDH